MTLTELICKYREDHGFSQRQFALRCGLSNGYISMLERGENPKTHQPITPTIQALIKLADGMGMTLTDLFTTIDDMPVDIGAKKTATANGVGLSKIKRKAINLIEHMTDEECEKLVSFIEMAKK